MKEQTRINEFSIEMDCPPGDPRPFDLIEGVLKDTGLTAEDFDTGRPFFGHQMWVLKENAEKEALYIEHRHKTIKPRIVNLNERNIIRYGSW
jgi:hypothetical protein